MVYFFCVIINLHFMESTYLIDDVSFLVSFYSPTWLIRKDCHLLFNILIGAYFPIFTDAVGFAFNLVCFFEPVSRCVFKVSKSEVSKLDCTDEEFYFVKLVINVS